MFSVWLSIPNPTVSPTQQKFLTLLMAQAGSPLLWAIGLAAGIFGYAYWRKVPGAEVGLNVWLLAATMVDGSQLGSTLRAAPWVWPVVVATLWNVFWAWRLRTTVRLWTAAALGILALTLALWNTRFTAGYGFLPLHLLLLATLLIGALRHDFAAHCLRQLAAAGLASLGLAFLLGTTPPLPNIPVWFFVPYLALLAALCGYFTWRWRSRTYFTAALLDLTACTSQSVILLHLWLRHTALHRGLDAFLWSAVFFLLAILVSLSKAGFLHRALAQLRRHLTPLP